MKITLEPVEVAQKLREIGRLLELAGENQFKVRAYDKGASSLEAVRDPLDVLVREKRLTELPGIGAALAAQIEELSATGTSKVLDELRAKFPPGIIELSKVRGIGLSTLREVHEKLGIATIDELKRAAEEGRIRVLPGFGAKREAKILEALERHEIAEASLLLSEGLEAARAFEAALDPKSGVTAVHLSGPQRRFIEVTDRVVVIAEGNDPKAVIDAVAAMPGVVESQDETTCTKRLPDNTKIEVVACTREQTPTTLAAHSSSAAHFDKLVAHAKDKGLRLEAAGLFDAKTGKRVSLDDEASLYAALGLSFVPPELRENDGEIERAARGDVFDLVALSDVKGFVHCHSTWSDGKGTIEEMARAAKERGASYLTVTDHSKTAQYAGGLDRDRLERQWEEIARVEETVGIRLLRGTEADILADGALDFPDAILEKLDVVIASIHQRHGQDEAQMTDRLVRAMRHPCFKIWGHPLGRLLTSRPPVAARVEEVLDALASSRGAIEINGDPKRLDIEPKWGKAARERGIPFVLSVDAHSVRELVNTRYAVGLARRAYVTSRDVLNTRDADAFALAVRPTG